MGDDYWNSSSVKKAVNRQAIFETDGGNTLDRFKNRTDPLIDRILDSSRSTPPVNTTGATSNRYRPTSTPTPIPPPPTTTTKKIDPPITTKTVPNIQPKVNIPAAQVPRTLNQPTESARFGRAQTAASSNDVHSSAQWQPNAEEYPDQTAKDRSTQYDKEMEMRCKDLLENKSVKLDDIRDYDKKASLLRMAISFNTPSVTVPVMVFLENTLSRPLFYELIKKHRSAVNNYINMAKLQFENDYYIAMLKQFDRNEDVAMIRVRQASQTSDINAKIAILDQAAIELQSHQWWHLQVAEHRHLLSKQRELQSSLLSSQTNTRLENRTALETFKIVYETDFRRQKQSRNTDKSIIDRSKELETAFHMSQEMIMCGKLSVIMQCGLRAHYDDFIHQAIHQGIFGKKYIIAPENLADMVFNWVRVSGEGQEKASEKAERFLTMIPDPGKRIYFAEKFQNFDVAMDTIVNILRDRTQLENLRKRMPHDHPSFNRATALLENTKWRN